MRIDRKGHRFEPRNIRPEERLSVNNLARAIGSPEKAYLSTEAAQSAGYAARPVPPGMLTFFNTMDETDLVTELGVVYGKTLFAGTEFEFGVVATENQTIVGQTTVEDAYERAGRDGTVRQFLILVSEFRTEDGDLVGRSRLTFIERAEAG